MPQEAGAFFLPVDPGLRFCLLHAPTQRPVLGLILHVHPFAEEMNKCRRMSAMMARVLAQSGWVVLQIDLLGCGDSSGEFVEARWDHWLHDIRTAHDWARSRYEGPVWLWGVRAGALLAAAALEDMAHAAGLVLWQPVISGAQHLTHLLRIKAASQMLEGSSQAFTTRALRERIAAGETLEIAGYEISPGLARSLDSAELRVPPLLRGTTIWIEVSPAKPPSVAPGSQARIDQFEQQGWRVDATAVEGEPFWQTVDMAECPSLASATLRALHERR